MEYIRCKKKKKKLLHKVMVTKTIDVMKNVTIL